MAFVRVLEAAVVCVKVAIGRRIRARNAAAVVEMQDVPNVAFVLLALPMFLAKDMPLLLLLLMTKVL